MVLIARVLSVVLHPLLMPVLAVWSALQVDPHLGYFLPLDAQWLMLGMLTLMTVAFPITSALLLLRAGLVSGLEMPERRERIAPYLMTLVYYGMAYYLLRKAPLHPAVDGMFLGAIVALAITTLITLRWKISAHMVGIGGLLGALMGIALIHDLALIPVLAGIILLAGLLGSARLLTSDHTQGQIIAGALLGWVCTHAAVVLGWSI